MNGEGRRIKDIHRVYPGYSVARGDLGPRPEPSPVARPGSRAPRRKRCEDVADERPRRVEAAIGVDEAREKGKLVYNPMGYRAVTKKYRRNEINRVGIKIRHDRSIRPYAPVRTALFRMGNGERTGAPKEDNPGVRAENSRKDGNGPGAYEENVPSGDTTKVISSSLAGGSG